MRVRRPARDQPTVTRRPMRAGLASMVAALRGAVAVGAGVAAVVGAVRPVSWAWLGPALALLFAWTPGYVAVAWTRGLRPWLIGVDLCVAAGLALAVGHLVPPAALPGTASWVAVIVAMTVVSAQLNGSPRVSVPAGLLVVACLVTGQRLAHSPDGGMDVLAIQTVQTLVAAAVMAAAMRIERTAVSSFTRLQEAQASAALDLAKREDERAQLRLVHNGPLTTLTMALHSTAAEPGATGDSGATGAPSVALRRRVATRILWTASTSSCFSTSSGHSSIFCVRS